MRSSGPDGPGGCPVSIAEDASKGPGTVVPMPLRQLGVLPRNEGAELLASRRGRNHREWLAGGDT